MGSVIGVIEWQWSAANPFDEPGWRLLCPSGHPVYHQRSLQDQGMVACPFPNLHGGAPTFVYFQSDAARNDYLTVVISAAEASHIASSQLGKAAALAYLGVTWPPP